MAWAQSFVVRNIEIEGLQRISSETVRSYLPIKPGQVLRPEKTAQIIKALYKTGFFEHITLAREGNTLVIRVVERPTIGQLKISGNSVIPTDKLTTVMKSVDVAEGRAYDSAILDKIKLSLLDQYYQLGRYNARVDVKVTPQPRNRVLVQIDISEGLVAKIRQINIIGNHAFGEGTLIRHMDISTPGVISFFTQNDRYSQEKVEQSIEDLRTYYLDRGYIRFTTKSTQVSITPDRKSVYVTIVIDEGVPYTIKGVELSGNLILPRSELMQRIKIRPGDTFSRQAVIDSEKAVSTALGDHGYIFAVVSINPSIDDRTKQVFLNFNVKPGKRAYVRNIYFIDNSKTNDEALRREMLQMESSVISTTRLEESKHNLSLLPYIKKVEMAIVPVQNSDDQVDVNYKVTEDNSAQATLSVGYSQLDHLLFGAGFNQKNFLGTGKTLGVNATTSRYQKFIGINYVDPYYTLDGISRSISMSASRTDPAAANLSTSYTSNEYNASVVYGIPLGQQKDVKNLVQLGYGYQNLLINVPSTPTSISNQVQNFINAHGRHYQQFDLITAYSRNSLDKSIFPTSGMLHTIGLNVYLPIDKSLSYYTASYSGKWYHPVYGPFIATARGDAAYGTGFNGAQNFPIFQNFYAGGIGSVRGYEAYTLGPKDSLTQPSGGNLLADASVGLIFPNYISDNLRTTAFVDGGNVWNTYDNRPSGGTASGTLRYSVGVEGDWLSPFGMVSVSLAKALNLKHARNSGGLSIGDTSRAFDFSLGANFG